jgi:hypothetical protein
VAPERIWGARGEVGCTKSIWRHQGLIKKYRAKLSDLLLLNHTLIVHNYAWYRPENPEFAYKCQIYIQGTSLGFQIERGNYEFRGRRLL